MMAKKFVVGYKVDPTEKVEKMRDVIVKKHRRLWSHAVNKPAFEYVLDGDVEKAKAVANILRKVKDVAKLNRERFEVVGDE